MHDHEESVMPNLHTAQYKEMFVKGSSERRDDGEAHADRN